MEQRRNDNSQPKPTDPPRYLLQPFQQYLPPPTEQDIYYRTPNYIYHSNSQTPLPTQQTHNFDSFGASSVSGLDPDSHDYAELYSDIEQLVSVVNTSESLGVEAHALPLDLRRSSAAAQRLYAAVSAQHDVAVTTMRRVIQELHDVVTGVYPPLVTIPIQSIYCLCTAQRASLMSSNIYY